MSIIPVREEQPLFKQKKDYEGKYLAAGSALGGVSTGAATLMAGSKTAALASASPYLGYAGLALMAASAIREATRPRPDAGKFVGGSSNAPMVAMSQRVDAMKGDPYAQMVQARSALDQIPMDYDTKVQYAKPLDDAMYAYQQRYRRGSV